VVCYYLTASGGALYARFQRENFGVANLVIEDPGLDSLMAVDRGRGVLASYMVVELSGKRVFAAVYPPWPIFAVDIATASVGLLADGECRELVVVSGPYFDGGTASLELGSDGSCDSCILIISTEEPFAEATLALSSNGSCDQLVIVSGPYFDAASASLGLTSNGVCDEIVIAGGSYTDAVASALVINSDGDCSTI